MTVIDFRWEMLLGAESPYGAYDLVQNIYNLSNKPIPGKYQNKVDKPDAYFSPEGMARGGTVA